jgi:hypothetical protein
MSTLVQAIVLEMKEPPTIERLNRAISEKRTETMDGPKAPTSGENKEEEEG